MKERDKEKQFYLSALNQDLGARPKVRKWDSEIRAHLPPAAVTIALVLIDSWF